ncbi:unnamed protein product [Schistocephalus solidus]|uniref:Transcription factor n=1 Tax=Schistocephalus solidus TaxID=70667 RepID=A0A183TSD7_SCHSO|nr:unnamed protein product [Schistocephalus solidus]
MRISSAKGYVEILSYEMRHNHPPSLEASGEYQPHSWLLSGISINEDESLVVKRRRRAKNRYNERPPKPDPSHVLSDHNVELIRPQLEKLRDLALSASTDRFHTFLAQLSDFESEWKARLNVRSRTGQSGSPPAEKLNLVSHEDGEQPPNIDDQPITHYVSDDVVEFYPSPGLWSVV